MPNLTGFVFGVLATLAITTKEGKEIINDMVGVAKSKLEAIAKNNYIISDNSVKKEGTQNDD